MQQKLQLQLRKVPSLSHRMENVHQDISYMTTCVSLSLLIKIHQKLLRAKVWAVLQIRLRQKKESIHLISLVREILAVYHLVRLRRIQQTVLKELILMVENVLTTDNHFQLEIVLQDGI